MTHRIPHPADALLAEITAFCERTGMSRSAFGMKAVGDPSLVRGLYAGRDVRLGTAAKIRAFIASAEATS